MRANRCLSHVWRERALRPRTTAAHWVEVFEAAGIPAGPINTMDKVFADPQVQHIGMAAPLKTKLFGDTKFVASPLNFHGMPRKLRCETPEPGQHTEEVLNWIGISKDEQATLKAAGAI